MEIGIREVKAKCSALMEMAHRGRCVVVTKHGVPWADIVPHRQHKRKLGPLPGVTGRITLADAVAPLSGEELAAWE